jgi:glycosyltransferase involved in cell wall biosynthesis
MDELVTCCAYHPFEVIRCESILFRRQNQTYGYNGRQMKVSEIIHSYVLITPAHNEGKNIGRLLVSVASQTSLPIKWVIVNDASTDNTAEVVQDFLRDFPWIELISMPESQDHNFASKVICFNAGYELVKSLDFDIIGNLDADVSFENDYFEFLLDKFAKDPSLGVGGTPFVEDNGYSSIEDSFEGEKHVAGGCQLFKRKCFEEIGGYITNREGGIDWIAVTTARMKGWTTRSFREKVFHHHRSLGTGRSGSVLAIYNYGRKDFYLGNHQFWELIRALYRMAKRPYVYGGIILFSGYLWASISRMNRPISKELIRFHRKEEMQTLSTIFKMILKRKKIKSYALDE